MTPFITKRGRHLKFSAVHYIRKRAQLGVRRIDINVRPICVTDMDIEICKEKTLFVRRALRNCDE